MKSIKKISKNTRTKKSKLEMNEMKIDGWNIPITERSIRHRSLLQELL